MHGLSRKAHPTRPSGQERTASGLSTDLIVFHNDVPRAIARPSYGFGLVLQGVPAVWHTAAKRLIIAALQVALRPTWTSHNCDVENYVEEPTKSNQDC